MKNVTKKRKKRSRTNGPGETRSTLMMKANHSALEAAVEVVGVAVRGT